MPTLSATADRAAAIARAAEHAAHVAAFDARRTPEERAAIAEAAAYRITAPYRPGDAGDGNRIGGHRD